MAGLPGKQEELATSGALPERQAGEEAGPRLRGHQGPLLVT